MGYQLQFTKKAHRQFAALDSYVQGKIRAYLNKHVHDCDNPRAAGKPLSADLAGYWRYRIGDYRVVCEINDGAFVVVAVQIGHRSKIYR